MLIGEVTKYGLNCKFQSIADDLTESMSGSFRHLSTHPEPTLVERNPMLPVLPLDVAIPHLLELP